MRLHSHLRKIFWSVVASFSVITTCAAQNPQTDTTHSNEVFTSVNADLLLDAAGSAQRSSLKNIYLIGCRRGDVVSFGTGFLLASGVIVTNAHVVTPCSGFQLAGISTTNQKVVFSKTVTDVARDLAVLVPATKLDGGYDLAKSENPEPGTQVVTWGYPFAYTGTSPLLSVGYVAGYRNATENGKTVKHIVVNGAFNHGNSGGPLLVSRQNLVVGIVVLTFHFYPPQTRQIIDALNANSGTEVVFTSRLPDGTTKNFVESQLTAAVLDEFYNKTQIDIGEAIAVSELRDFIKERSAEFPQALVDQVKPTKSK